jgi:hypothetical protein
MTTTSLVLAGASSALPWLFTARPETKRRLRDFFSSHIRNRHTRRAYMEAVHIAAFVERHLQTNSRPTVKLRLVYDRRSDEISLDEVERIAI